MDENAELSNRLPTSIVETWLWMLRESNDPVLIDQATDNLLQQFSSLSEVEAYILTADSPR